MSQRFLETYCLQMTALSPIHIGAGIKLNCQTDFFVQDKTLYVIAENKLIDWLSRQGNANRLLSLLSDSLRKPDEGIKSFLKSTFRSDLKNIAAYILPCLFEPREILPFIRTSDFQPYLPGTSIKGALRSALLRGRMRSEADLCQQAEKLINNADAKALKNISNTIEASVFAPNAPGDSKRSYYDINRLFTIRDGAPLDQNALAIVPVKVVSITGNWLQVKKLPNGKEMILYVETITPKTRWHHEFVWQTQLLSEQASTLGFQSIKDLLIFLPNHCRRASESLLSQERDFYYRHKRPNLADWFDRQLQRLIQQEEIFILPLGWGSGYDAKTITDLLSEETFETAVKKFKYIQGLGKPNRDPQKKWLGALDSPKSRKVAVQVNGSLLPLGWVEVRLAPSESTRDWLAQERQALQSRKPTPIPFSANQSPAMPKAQAKPAAPQPQATFPKRQEPVALPAKPLIRKFTKLPEPGDRFQGTVLYTEINGSVYLELPGLSPEDQAMGVISHEYALGKKYREKQPINCEVIAVEPDRYQKNLLLVKCRPEK